MPHVLKQSWSLVCNTNSKNAIPEHDVMYVKFIKQTELITTHVVNGFPYSRKATEAMMFSEELDILYPLETRL